jgi:hypothetical protein
VPFLRFSRDRRGYEHFYLVEQGTGRRRNKSRARVLFWFRTPPNIKVGREPFPEEVRRALEAEYPAMTFDWEKLAATPIPPLPPDATRWRERRRAERAARQTPEEESAASEAGVTTIDEEAPVEPPEAALQAAAGTVPEAGPDSKPQGRRRRRRRGRRRSRPPQAAGPEPSSNIYDSGSEIAAQKAPEMPDSGSSDEGV